MIIILVWLTGNGWCEAHKDWPLEFVVDTIPQELRVKEKKMFLCENATAKDMAFFRSFRFMDISLFPFYTDALKLIESFTFILEAGNAETRMRE